MCRFLRRLMMGRMTRLFIRTHSLGVGKIFFSLLVKIYFYFCEISLRRLLRPIKKLLCFY